MISQHFRWFLVLTLAIVITSCSPITDPPKTQVLSLLINNSSNPFPTVVTSPMTLKAQVLLKGSGTVEFFKNDQSLGKVFLGIPTEKGTDFSLEIPITKAENGQNEYTAELSSQEILGSGNYTFPSNRIVATIQVP